MIMSRADAGIYVIVYQTEFLVEEHDGGQREKEDSKRESTKDSKIDLRRKEKGESEKD